MITLKFYKFTADMNIERMNGCAYVSGTSKTLGSSEISVCSHLNTLARTKRSKKERLYCILGKDLSKSNINAK